MVRLDDVSRVERLLDDIEARIAEDTFGSDQFVKLFDLVAERDGQCVRLDKAGVANGLHGSRTPLWGVVVLAHSGSEAFKTEPTSGQSC